VAVPGREAPDPRALRVVLSAARGLNPSDAAFSTQLDSAVRNHPEAGGLEPALLARTGAQYADAVRGFVRPQASTGYVLAGLYTRRRRMAIMLGIPLLGIIGWGLLWKYKENIDQEERRTAVLILVSHQRTFYQERLNALKADTERTGILLRGDACDPRLAAKASDQLKAAVAALDTARGQLESLGGLEAKSEPVLRRDTVQLGKVKELLDDVETKLQLSTGFRVAGREIQTGRRALENLKREGQGFEPPESFYTLYHAGVGAADRGDTERLLELVNDLRGHVRDLREAAALPAKLDAALKRVQSLTTLESVRSKAVALHRQGVAERSTAVLKDLDALAERLGEEYTFVVTGGKWRYRNDNPSLKTYYLIVEARDGQGKLLPRRIQNEETGRWESTSTWGERVPFAVYERVRVDKQDNGVIDEKLFGRKVRGTLDDELLFPSEDRSAVVPRVGQITKW